MTDDRVVDLTATGLDVLVVGTDDWAIEQTAASLARAGHRVLRCHEPGEPPFPCNALRAGRTCPLDAGFDVAVDVRTRPADRPTDGELGVVCALRIGRPLVTAGMVHQNPFEPWTTVAVGEDDGVADAVVRAMALVAPRA